MAWLIKRGKIWYVSHRDEDGKLKAFSTKTNVKKRALEVMSSFEEGNLPIGQRKVTLGDFVKSHLAHADQTLSPGWAKNKRLIFDNILLPYLGEKTRLKNITQRKIENFRAKRLETVSNRTVNIEVNCLMTMLRQAVEWGDLETRHLPTIKKLKESKGRLRYLSTNEIKQLRETAEQHSQGMKAYIMLMLYCGLRSGEALALRWVDVDIVHKAIHVTPYSGWSPKSKLARVVPLPDELFQFLDDCSGLISGTELTVFDEKYTPYMLKRQFSKVVLEAGLSTEGTDKVTAHTLRHSYASHLVMSGVPLYTVAALLGHSSVKTTEIYAHLAPDHLQSAVAEIRY